MFVLTGDVTLVARTFDFVHVLIQFKIWILLFIMKKKIADKRSTIWSDTSGNIWA